MADTYSEKLRNPKWQKRRLEILNRDHWTCQLCGDKETTLHVHHNYYNGNPWDAKDAGLITLCEDCHKIEECQKADNTTSIGVLKIKMANRLVMFVYTQSGEIRFYEFGINRKLNTIIYFEDADMVEKLFRFFISTNQTFKIV